MLYSLLGMLLWTGLGATPNVLATTTTLNFDTAPDGSVIQSGTSISSQYQTVGVTVSGATADNASLEAQRANTAPNIAFAPTGMMTFTLNPAITGNVQSVSAYITAGLGVSIYAYDASGSLVGQTLASDGVELSLTSVTSSGNPITTVQIHDGGYTFFVDTLKFTTADLPFSRFGAALYLAPKVSAFAVAETFTLGERSAALNPTTQKVTLRIGALTLNLPAGSFAEDGPPRKGSYVFRGAANGVNLYVSISPTRVPKTYLLFAIGAGYIFQSGLTSMPVGLNIGENAGNLEVKPNYVPQPPSSP
ncbi:hypothetical protein [Paraburkholderia caribensis]|uniref:hypothetical protein n=1 Tax=Paraburkholderia caribensis TaxID=75105 RepID=UPI001CC6B814|nr:hypothetical protein [Paraburkholderia caribensis]